MNDRAIQRSFTPPMNDLYDLTSYFKTQLMDTVDGFKSAGYRVADPSKLKDIMTDVSALPDHDPHDPAVVMTCDKDSALPYSMVMLHKSDEAAPELMFAAEKPSQEQLQALSDPFSGFDATVIPLPSGDVVVHISLQVDDIGPGESNRIGLAETLDELKQTGVSTIPFPYNSPALRCLPMFGAKYNLLPLGDSPKVGVAPNDVDCPRVLANYLRDDYRNLMAPLPPVAEKAMRQILDVGTLRRSNTLSNSMGMRPR